MALENFLRQSQRARCARRQRWRLSSAGRQSLRIGEESTSRDDVAFNGVPALHEGFERHLLAALQAAQDRMVGHQHALTDIVARVNGRERCGDRDANAAPLLRLHGGLA